MQAHSTEESSQEGDSICPASWSSARCLAPIVSPLQTSTKHQKREKNTRMGSKKSISFPFPRLLQPPSVFLARQRDVPVSGRSIIAEAFAPVVRATFPLISISADSVRAGEAALPLRDSRASPVLVRLHACHMLGAPSFGCLNIVTIQCFVCVSC